MSDKSEMEEIPTSPASDTAQPSWVTRHPLVVVAVGASLVGLGHALWVWRYRHTGGLDPDESGYIAGSMQLHRVLVQGDLWQFVRLVGSTGNGITTPLLSVPLLLIGPLDPRTAMMAQPILVAFAAIAVAGIARRIGGSWSAIAAGLIFATLPTTANATQSYWYGLSAAAFAAAALWALLCSERCTNRRIWWFGVFVGLMLLSRTMTLGFLPAMLASALIAAGWNRRNLVRAGLGFGLGLLIATPWYVYNASSIFGYLFSYGYGKRSALFGNHGTVFDRMGERFLRIGSGGTGDTPFPMLLFLLGLVLVGSVVLAVRFVAARPTGGGSWRAIAPAVAEDPRWRAGAAVGVASVLSYAALVSTANGGVWFELPVIAMVVALLVGVLGATPWPVKTLVSVAAIVSATVVHAQLWWLVDYHKGDLTSHYEYGFDQYDTRFGPDTRSLHPEAAGDWRRFNERVLRDLQRGHTPSNDPVVTISGNMQLFNSNSLWLTGELAGRPPIVDVPDTAWSRRRLLDELTPTAEVDGLRRERVLVISLHHRILFTPDEGVEKFLRLAKSQGWRTTDREELPTGGEVQILRRPSPGRSGG